LEAPDGGLWESRPTSGCLPFTTTKKVDAHGLGSGEGPPSLLTHLSLFSSQRPGCHLQDSEECPRLAAQGQVVSWALATKGQTPGASSNLSTQSTRLFPCSGKKSGAEEAQGLPGSEASLHLPPALARGQCVWCRMGGTCWRPLPALGREQRGGWSRAGICDSIDLAGLGATQGNGTSERLTDRLAQDHPGHAGLRGLVRAQVRRRPACKELN
jgi:hypothetical protein